MSTRANNLQQAIKACRLALTAACDDCVGDVTVTYERGSDAEWTVVVDHDPTCPTRRKD